VLTSHPAGHRVKAGLALRGGAVNARRPRGTRGRSGAQSIDGAEHSGTLDDVMAGVQIACRITVRSPAVIQQNAVVIAGQNPLQVAI
jgi:hypothetical protein